MAKKISRAKAASPTALFQLLADQNRFRAITLLAETRRGLLAGEIAETLRIEQSAASHLLGLLYGRDIVQSQKNGRTVRYFLSSAPITKTLLKVIRAAA